MSDEEASEITNTGEQKLEGDIEKEISKLKYFLEETNEITQAKDYGEMEAINNRAGKIIVKISELISQTEELKIDNGKTPRSVRQWKKETRAKYSALIEDKEKIVQQLKEKQEKAYDEAELRRLELKDKQFQQEEQRRAEIREAQEERERQLWQERHEAELRMTQRKIAIEKTARSSAAKLPKLKITPFNGTPTDWVRFENMFLTLVHEKASTAEEKYGFLLEMVSPKVREKIANLKPGEVGYKIAWERLKSEYGHPKHVINAHMDAIINLTPVRGHNYEKVQDFYEKLSKNFDALQTLGESEKLSGFVMTTINKLPHIKPDLVRVDDDWEEWSMEVLIKNLQKWLRRNKVDDASNQKETRYKKPEGQWYQKSSGPPKPHCVFCANNEHWSDQCKTVKRLADRKKFFAEKNLCFNCGRTGHRGNQCRSRGCLKCNAKHHTSLCDKNEDNQENKTSLTGFTTLTEDKSLPAIIPVNVKGQTLWAYLDTGSSRNFISREAVKKLDLNPTHHESREIVTVNGTSTQSMPIFQTTITSLDGKVHEEIELTGSRLQDFTTVKRPDMNELKMKYTHTQDKRFYMTAKGEHPIHLILGDGTYSRIRTEKVYKGNLGDPLVEETTFGWVIHGGEDYSSDACMFTREVYDYEQLYSLDVLGVEDRGENDQMQVLAEFRENITRQEDGRYQVSRYQVSIPWIPGSKLTTTNEQPSRRRLFNVNKKLAKDGNLKQEYEKIINDQLASGVIEKAPDEPSGERVYYMPHKPVVRQDASTTKVRMVFDASSKPHPLASSINNCMFTGPPLQPLLWDIMVRARMSSNLLLADIQKAFLQIAIKEEDRDAFRFLFERDEKEEHFRFARVPFGVEASPFLLGATLEYHYDQQSPELEETVTTLRENTYVDNIMQTGNNIDKLEKFKKESEVVLESAKLPIHKWESNIATLEDENMPNPSKILGHVWDKREDTLEIQVPAVPETEPVTKRSILSQLGKVYDPLGIISPTMAEGKHIYREACEEKKGWNVEVSPELKKQWHKWNKQLKNVKVPRSLTGNSKETKVIELHVFADASNLACSAVTIAVVEHSSGTIKGLLTSKSRISKRNTSIPRLELVGAHMAANMAKNLRNALHRHPIKTIVIWLDSMVVLYWLTNPGKPWKTFVSNRIKKIAEITNELGIIWKYCPSNKNLADLGSRGATMEKLQNGSWFNGPDWLLEKEQWPEQPNLKVTTSVSQECKPIKEQALFTKDREPDEWDALLERNTYWRTLRVTAWALRFLNNCLARVRRNQKRSGPLVSEEITIAKAKNNAWKRWQREYIHSLMESQRVNGKPVNAPEVGEVVLVVGEEKNGSEWKKGRVVRQVKGKDGVVRGVVLLHKGHTIERPLQLVCPLEIRCTTQIEQRKNEEKQTVENERKKRGAAIEASKKIRELAENEDAD